MLAFVWRKISKNYKKKFDDVAIREVPLNKHFLKIIRENQNLTSSLSVFKAPQCHTADTIFHDLYVIQLPFSYIFHSKS